MHPSELKIGDRIRIIDIAGNGKPGYYLHPDTKRVYKKLIKRKKPVKINEIDEDGIPWYECRFRRKKGGLEHHFLSVAEGDNNWVKVKPRTGD